MITREAVLADVIRIVGSLAADWDYTGVIDESTRLFVDLNWQSIDMVVLAHELQTHYRQTFPFPDFFAAQILRENPGVGVGELADFIVANLQVTAAQPQIAE